LKLLSAFNQAAIDNPCTDPIRLLTVELDSLTLRLCDRAFGAPGSEFFFDGQLYEPLVLEWGTIRGGRIDPVSLEVEPAETEIVIDNNTPVGGAQRLAALFATHDPHYAVVTVSLIMAGAAAAGDRIDLFKGRIEDPQGMAADRLTLACSGIELDIANRFSHTILTTLDRPGADPDDIGKMVPVVYGRASMVPALAVDAGGRSSIASDMAPEVPADGQSLEISDATAFPASGSFVIQIDSEQISIASRSGNLLSLAASGARGANGTQATAHDKGAAVSEIQTEYIYQLTDHPVGSIDAVYVDNVRQTDGFTAYSGKSGDEKSGYEGRAVVVFGALPLLKKQVNLQVDSSGRSAADAGHNHTTAPMNFTWYFDTAVRAHATEPQGQTNLVDGITGGNPALWYTGGFATRVTCSDSTPPNPGGTPTRYKICVAVGNNAGYISTNSVFRVNFGSPQNVFRVGYANLIAGTGTVFKSGWFTCSTAENTWALLGALSAIAFWEAGTGQLRINEVFIEVEYALTAPTGSAAVSLSGANILVGNSSAETVIGQRVAADLQGQIDDASGTITGTANALIERPDHIIKHILIGRCGLSAGEIHAASYNQAGAFYAANAFRLAVVMLQRPNVRALSNRIAHQASSIEFWEAGAHHLVRIADHSLDDYTKLLIHFDSDNGDIPLTTDDAGAGNHTVTLENGAAISAARSKFGGKSLYLDGADDNARIASHSDFSFGSDPFTVDFWVNFHTVSAGLNYYLFYRLSAQLDLHYNTSNDTLYFVGSSLAVLQKYNCGIVIDQWHHIAVIRGWGGDPNAMALCLDGLAIATGTATGSNDSSTAFYIGKRNDGLGPAPAYIEEFRISRGVARWTANFTPPASAYPFIGPGGGSTATPVKKIEANRIDLGQLWIAYTNRVNIQNRISACYARDWSGYESDIEAHRAIVTASDAASIAQYGTLERDPASYPYIIDTGMAQAVVDWRLADLARPRLVLELAGGLWLTDLENGDLIAFDFEAGDLLDQALLGLVTPGVDLFRVMDKLCRPDATVQIRLVRLA